MPTPTTLQNVDDRGYVFVTEAADCQILASVKAVTEDSPTPIPVDSTGNPRNLPGRRRIYPKNNDAVSGGQTVFVGDSAITTSTGYPIVPQDELILDITDDIQLHAIVVDTESVDLRMLELA